ncbi:hypothetical protein TrLO_g7224 [Triparma laevis f. longispina]|uniref:Pentatricopeptide repeat-containing protein n=1 Tax=Triparma laevis f. longispina TaxID=1714387 RepID=A0A9W7DRP7_9STRA|nr:hypothetical protein TrLO_g7224 [Triparma laevis f. longispina]
MPTLGLLFSTTSRSSNALFRHRISPPALLRLYSATQSPSADGSTHYKSTNKKKKKTSKHPSGSSNKDLKRVDSLNDDAKFRMFEEVSFSVQNHSKNPLPYTLKNTYTKRARRVLDLLLLPLKTGRGEGSEGVRFDNPFLKDNALNPHFPFAIRQICNQRKDLNLISNLPLAHELLKQTSEGLSNPLSLKDTETLLRGYNEMLAGCLKGVKHSRNKIHSNMNMKLAEEVYENFPFHLTPMDKVTHNTISWIYLKLGFPELAQRTFSNLTEFDSHSYSLGLQISKALRDLEAAEGIWKEFEKEYTNEACLFIGLSQLIDTVRLVYEEQGDKEDSQSLHDKVLHYYDLALTLSSTCASPPTIHSDFSMVLNSRILAATAFGRLDDLHALKSELEERKVVGNVSPYVALLQGIRAQIKSQDVKVLKGLELATNTTSLLTSMLKQNNKDADENNKRSNNYWYLNNSKTGFTYLTNIFVDVLSPAVDTFGKVRKTSLHASGEDTKNGINFTDLPYDITLTDVKNDDESRRIVCQMALEEYDKLRDAGVRPSRVAFINVVKVLGYAQLFDVAFDLLTEETRSDVERRLESKRKFGGQGDDRGFVTSLEAWNEYILSFAGFGGVGGVGGGGRLQLSDAFEKMLKLGVKPNHVTFNNMAHVYKCNGEGAESFKLLDYMIRCYSGEGVVGVKGGGVYDSSEENWNRNWNYPNRHIFATVLDSFGRSEAEGSRAVQVLVMALRGGKGVETENDWLNIFWRVFVRVGFKVEVLINVTEEHGGEGVWADEAKLVAILKCIRHCRTEDDAREQGQIVMKLIEQQGGGINLGYYRAFTSSVLNSLSPLQNEQPLSRVQEKKNYRLCLEFFKEAKKFGIVNEWSLKKGFGVCDLHSLNVPLALGCVQHALENNENLTAIEIITGSHVMRDEWAEKHGVKAQLNDLFASLDCEAGIRRITDNGGKVIIEGRENVRWVREAMQKARARGED